MQPYKCLDDKSTDPDSQNTFWVVDWNFQYVHKEPAFLYVPALKGQPFTN